MRPEAIAASPAGMPRASSAGSAACVFPDNLRAVHDGVRGPKRLVWGDGTRTDYYDQPAQVRTAVEAIDGFLEEMADEPVRRRQ